MTMDEAIENEREEYELMHGDLFEQPGLVVRAGLRIERMGPSDGTPAHVFARDLCWDAWDRWEFSTAAENETLAGMSETGLECGEKLHRGCTHCD